MLYAQTIFANRFPVVSLDLSHMQVRGGFGTSRNEDSEHTVNAFSPHLTALFCLCNRLFEL